MQFLLGTPVTELAALTKHSRRVTSRSCTITETFLIMVVTSWMYMESHFLDNLCQVVELKVRVS